MKRNRSFTFGAAAGLMALSAALAFPVRAGAGVTVAILPASQTVAPGATFDVTVQVTATGTPFNGFHLAVSYDPAALTPVAMSPVSNQYGALMTSACGNSPFHMFAFGAGVDSVDYALLCADTYVSGPGTIYKLRFVASSTVQTTTLGFTPMLKFANAGIVVPTTSARGAAVGIGTVPVTGVGDGPTPAALSLSASPNPAHDDVAFAFGSPLAAAAPLRVSDVQGRTVRAFLVPAGARTARWDARGANGQAVEPGVYLVELRRGARRDVVRVAIVR